MTRLTALKINEVSLVDRGANPGAHITLFKRDATSDGGTATSDAKEEVMAGTKKQDVAQPEVAAPAVETPAPVVETPAVAPAPAADVTAEMEKRDREIADLRKRVADSEKIAKEERDARLTNEAIAKAAKEYPHAGTPEVLGPILKRARGNELTADDVAELERTLKAASEQLKTSALFKEVGDGGAEKGGAREQLKQAAAELRKADPKLSEAQAITKAMNANPKLAAEARAEERSLH